MNLHHMLGLALATYFWPSLLGDDSFSSLPGIFSAMVFLVAVVYYLGVLLVITLSILSSYYLATGKRATFLIRTTWTIYLAAYRAFPEHVIRMSHIANIIPKQKILVNVFL